MSVAFSSGENGVCVWGCAFQWIPKGDGIRISTYIDQEIIVLLCVTCFLPVTGISSYIDQGYCPSLIALFVSANNVVEHGRCLCWI